MRFSAATTAGRFMPQRLALRATLLLDCFRAMPRGMAGRTPPAKGAA
ncbi:MULTISPECIES: hypothetical protein [unclassified Mesorhizobium]|nr:MULTISPECIES: hypothetical protein [unclassified Mesorhizobium]MBN9258891.1 hypothetical protein [Mesorhizobium sp.]